MTLNFTPARRGASLNNRFEIDAVATDLITRFGAVILEDAVRFSSCRADAEDAYSRALEILFTKAPTADPEHLVPWLRTVVRREAAAIAKSTYNQTSVPLRDEDDLREADYGNPEKLAETIFDLEVGSEALGKLSTDQVRCMLAQAEGMTYDEIAERTGFTRRKVSRCVNDGRKAFARRLGDIAAGTECERVQPLLFKLLDGDADAAIAVRPHLRHCTGCRARLRTYERAPRNVAALFPPALVVIGASGKGVFGWLLGVWHALTAKLAGYLHAGERWAEVGAMKKAGVVAVVGVGIAGGGVAIHGASEPDARRGAAGARMAAPQPGRVVKLLDPIAPDPRPSARRHKHTTSSRSKPPVAQPAPVNQPRTKAPKPSAVQQIPEPVDDGSSEFLPEAR